MTYKAKYSCAMPPFLNKEIARVFTYITIDTDSEGFANIWRFYLWIKDSERFQTLSSHE